MKEKTSKIKIILISALFLSLVLLCSMVFVDRKINNVYASGGGPYYIGTIVNSNNDLYISNGIGYDFYSDSSCLNAITYSQMQIDSATTIYVKLKPEYTFKNIQVQGIISGESDASVVISDGNGTYDQSIYFPADLSENQLIKIETFVNAPGGTLTSDMTSLQVASIFDVTVTSSVATSSIKVSTLSPGSFSLSITNNLLLNGGIVLGENVSLEIVSDGDYTIKRNFGFDDAFSYMFYLPNINSNLVFGSGTIENDTISYYFNDGTSETYAVGGTIPTSDDTKYVIYTKVNTQTTPTMKGYLTIDGGAIFEREYSGTQYSFTDVGFETSQLHNYTGNMIKASNGGNISIWHHTTLQNNKTPGNDASGGSAICVLNGNLFMYGGTIKRCVSCQTFFNPPARTSSSLGDGGAILFNSQNSIGYIYSGEITQCESDNSSAISLWRESTLYFMGGLIHNNFSVGDFEYPAQAMSVYASATLYMYGGTVSDNHGINSLADMRISSSGTNTLCLYDGNIGSIGSNANSNVIYIFNGQVGFFTGITDDIMQGTVTHYGGDSYIVSLPYAVNGDGSQSVDVYGIRTDINPNITYKDFTTTGTGTVTNNNSTLNMLMKAGSYSITVFSTSMEKVYTVTVVDADITATAISRTMKTPVKASQTEDTATLKSAGTNNDGADGIIAYGISTTNNVSNVTWYAKGSNVTNFVSWDHGSPTFLNLTDLSSYYFFVKAAAVGVFAESVSPVGLQIIMRTVTSVVINEVNNAHKGGTYYLSAIVYGVADVSQSVTWNLSGHQNADTVLRSDGTLIIANDEPSLLLIVTATSVADTSMYGTLQISLVVFETKCSPLFSYTKITTGTNTTSTYSNGNFSVLNRFSYLAISNNNSLVINLSRAFPQGSKLALIDFNAEIPLFYYYVVNNSGNTSININSFNKMGSQSVSPMLNGEINNTIYVEYQLLVDLPENATATGNITINYYNASTLITNTSSTITITESNTITESISSPTILVEDNCLKADTTISASDADNELNKVLVYTLLDSAGNAVVLADNNGNNPTIQADTFAELYFGDDTATTTIQYFNGNNIIIDMGTANFTNKVAHLAIHNLYSGNYILKANVRVTALGAQYCLNDPTGLNQKQSAVIPYTHFEHIAVKATRVIEINTNQDKLLLKNTQKTVQFDVESLGYDLSSLQVELYRKDVETHNYTFVQTIAHNIQTTSSAYDKRISLTIPALTTGTYRLRFKVSDAYGSYYAEYTFLIS